MFFWSYLFEVVKKIETNHDYIYCLYTVYTLFHDGGPYHIETSSLICIANLLADWFLYDRDLGHEKVYKQYINSIYNRGLFL